MNPNDRTLLLIKVTSSQDYADKFLQGDLFARRLACFRKMENDSQRADILEASIVYPREQIRIAFQTTHTTTGKKVSWSCLQQTWPITPCYDSPPSITSMCSAHMLSILTT